jgi:hypothetical protein
VFFLFFFLFCAVRVSELWRDGFDVLLFVMLASDELAFFLTRNQIDEPLLYNHQITQQCNRYSTNPRTKSLSRGQDLAILFVV